MRISLVDPVGKTAGIYGGGGERMGGGADETGENGEDCDGALGGVEKRNMRKRERYSSS